MRFRLHVEGTMVRPAVWHIRALEGFELMRMIGWTDDMYKAPEGSFKLSDNLRLCNMAGNAYCMYHALPWMTASYITF
eukprot:3720930-Pyramimonas_sp.AAC.1